MRIAFLIGAFFLLAANVGLSQVEVTAADEAAVAAIWKLHLQSTNEHADVIAACRDFKKKSPASPLGVVCDGLAAWHLMKAQDTNSAAVIFEKLISTQQTDPMSKSGYTMARRWLTRLDREKVRVALKLLYDKAIEFPPSLDAMKTLPEAQRAPLTDRWGQKWIYRLAEFKALKGFRGQKYELSSAKLGADSDLAMALDKPYGMKVELKPGKITVPTPGMETVEFVAADEKQPKTILSVGSEFGGISFPFMGASILILFDGDYWAIMPRPKR